MEITCVQMDVLISFYIEGDLSDALREKVEEHMKNCPTCRAKYNILSSLFDDMNSVCKNNEENVYDEKTYPARQYRMFKNNLSAYVDNELPTKDCIKMKKFTINNKRARQELEDTYNIRKLMSNSFKKAKTDFKRDYSKKILKHLDIDDKMQFRFNPLIMVSAAFIMSVLLISAIVIYLLSID